MNIIVFNTVLDYGGVSSVFIKLSQGLNCNYVNTELVCFYNQRDSKLAKVVETKKGLISEITSLVKYIDDHNTEVIILAPCIHIIGIKIFSLIKRKRVKIITTVHMRPKFWLLNKTFNNKITNFLTRYSLKISDRVISVSNDLAKELLVMNLITDQKLVTIYNPIIEKEVLRHLPANIEDKGTIELVIVGWIYELKGQHIAIEALYKLNSSRYRLNIIGGIKDKEYYDSLLKMIEAYNLTNQVRFIGIVDNVKEYLKLMDVYILASHSEALPTVLIEALECGVPIIASNCKWGPAEILKNGEYGILYKVGDSTRLAFEISKLTKSNHGYNSFIHKSHIRANDFLEKKIINKYLNIISEIY